MDSGQFTILLEQWGQGDQSALKALTPIVYAQLRKLAAANLARERKGHTLQPTALVHEAYLKLVAQKEQHLQNRSHFYGVASRIMREILIDYARKTRAAKRGGGADKIPLDDVLVFTPEKSDSILALDEALQELAKKDERKAQLIELRYFVGLSKQEIAEVLKTTVAAITRENRLAEAWLQRYLNKKSIG